MRSRSNSAESPTRPKPCQQRPKGHHREETGYSGKGNVQRRPKEKDDVPQASTIIRSPKAEKKQRSSFKKREDLSRDDLLFLLSVLEGELQVTYYLILYSKLKKWGFFCFLFFSPLHFTANTHSFPIKETSYLVCWSWTNINYKACKTRSYPDTQNSYQHEKMLFS